MSEPRIASIADRLVFLINDEFLGFAATDLEITPRTQLEYLGLDSLDRLELLMAVEDEFGIEITDDTAEEFGMLERSTIEDFAVLVDQLIGD
jgi:acyl carrier protein